jgi:GT2 family glycosyltransferase
MNQKRAFLFAAGHEVGAAYNALITHILANPELSKWRYVLTLEDDNLPPPDAHIRLLETIEEGYDAVSGLYFTKGDINMPQAYGLPETYEKTGYLEFTPRNVVECLNAGKVMGVNGIAMGCALWRMDMFRDIPAPWYVTLAEWIPNEGVKVMTQDLSFCMQARKAGKRFAVDTSVKVGHLDKESGIVY